MPRKCCVPFCKSNCHIATEGYITMFSFPKDPDRKQQWLNSIPRDNFQPSTTAAVCIKHFSEQAIVREDRAIRSDGSVLVVPRKIPKLTDDAVPSKFPNQPSSITSECNLKSKEPEKTEKQQEAIASPTTVETATITETPTTIATAGEIAATPETTTATIVVMDVIKKEPGVDAISIQTSDNRNVEEKKPMLEYGNSVDLPMTEISRETVDHCSDLKSEMTFAETPEMIEFPIVKTEVEKESCEWGHLEEEAKVELQVTAEDEVSSESNGVSSNSGNIAPDGYALCGKKIYKCEICGKQVTNLTLHARVHTGEKPYRCDVCGRFFALQGNLRKHSIVHTGEKAFSCDVCGRNFAQSIQLKNHVTLHTGEKAFKCVVCGKSFALAGYLKEHARLHTSDKPFKCDVCGKCFTFSKYLRRHESSHTRKKPFRCEICGKNYAKLINLKNHAALHAGQQP
ncbi:zinc finger protein 99-like isoform X2 [Periplaneta americana]|uniref:zinc finger protein 99-like isoform X2 n=1 Tax=Periplaneta americana TaxID=6978 RepID=UPI0037E8FC32